MGTVELISRASTCIPGSGLGALSLSFQEEFRGGAGLAFERLQWLCAQAQVLVLCPHLLGTRPILGEAGRGSFL